MGELSVPLWPLKMGDTQVHTGLLALLEGRRKPQDPPSPGQAAGSSDPTGWCSTGSRATVCGDDSLMDLIHGPFLFQGFLIQISEVCLLYFMLLLLMNLEQK